MKKNKDSRIKTIMIVEDDFVCNEYFKFALNKKYNLLFAKTAEEALTLLSNNIINLILMDISIKGSINGLELTKIIRNELKLSNIPIFAVTAHAFDEDIISSKNAGCDLHLTKPISKNKLFDAIELYLDNKIEYD